MSDNGDILIPTIDLQAVDLASQIGEIYSTVGFAYLANHRVAPHLVDAAFAASKAFHQLPLAEKMAIEINEQHRGYMPIDTSTTKTSTIARVTRPNQSASLMVMHEVDLSRVQSEPLAGANQWPAGLAEIREPLLAYVAAMERVGRVLVTAIERALGAPPNALLQHFQRPTTFLRLLHYPAGNRTEADGYFGSAPHSDYGFLTLLAQDDVGGLQVRGADGAWLDVAPKPGTFVLNTADILHRWSNGRLISTPHRVLPATDADRYSLPFFFDPNVQTVVKPLTSCVQPGQAPSFQPVVYGDYLMHRLRSNHSQHQDPTR